MKMDAQMNIRTTSKVKKEAMEVFNNLGIDLTTAINVFLRKSIEYQGFPFEVNVLKPKRNLLKAIKEVEEEKNLIGPFKTVEELMEYLNA